MHTWFAFGLMILFFQQPDTEARIIEYLRNNLQPNQGVVVSDLFNDVFTSPEEQATLDRLYNVFFKIPMFLVQYQTSTGNVPSLQEIAEQFNFKVPGEADVILRVMEADPRVPRFFERDPDTGEIMSLDVEPIRSHPQFGTAIERTIAGWEGAPIPAFSMEAFDGSRVTSDAVAGTPHMVYVWFTNCPPCVQTAPLLVELYREYADSGFEIIAANADRFLELPYDDQIRADYVEELGIEFQMLHLSAEMQRAYGGVNIFPTMFFVDEDGVIVEHFVAFQEKDVLERAIQRALD